MPIRVLSRLFRRLLLEQLVQAHKEQHLKFYGAHTALTDAQLFARYREPVKRIDCMVYAKRPFAGPKPVLTYLSRYTHRIAIANSRLIHAEQPRFPPLGFRRHLPVSIRWDVGFIRRQLSSNTYQEQLYIYPD